MSDELRLSGIKQFSVEIERDEWKLDTLCDLFETLTVAQIVVFCNSICRVELLREQLAMRDFSVSTINTNLERAEWAETLREFRSGSSQILLVTEMSAAEPSAQIINLSLHDDEYVGLALSGVEISRCPAQSKVGALRQSLARALGCPCQSVQLLEGECLLDDDNCELSHRGFLAVPK